MNVTTRLIGPMDGDAVVDLWPMVEPMLIPALEREGWKLKPDQLFRQIADGLMGLYVVQDFQKGEIVAAMACEVQEYPNALVFSIGYCGGHDLETWVHLIADFEAEAKRLGCHVLRIGGRKGWGRIFPDYREVLRIYERELV